VSSSSARMFDAIGISTHFPAPGGPIRQIRTSDGLAPGSLTFDAGEEGEPLGWMHENRHLRAALRARAEAGKAITLRYQTSATHIDRGEHPRRRGRRRAGPPVERGIEAKVGIGGIDDGRRQAARVERGGERQSDQPSAKDDDVALLHGVPLRIRARRGKPDPDEESLAPGVPHKALCARDK
jgi:2-polyprenyl-6-methoxyphenol hydroxylase-like FAD-dependent oxidoreductase